MNENPLLQRLSGSSSQEKTKDFLLNGKPVIVLSGNEFARKEGYTLTGQVAEYYNSIGNVVISPDYGEVVLDEKGVDDDLAHGMGRQKAVAFAAVPAVITKGRILLPFGKYKEGENIVSAMIAAPIQIAEKEYVCVVVLRKRQEINKLYVHEVTLKEKLLDIKNNNNNQEVKPASSIGSSNPTLSLATNQGNVAKVLQNVLTAK
jgi:hypothetical protein